MPKSTENGIFCRDLSKSYGEKNVICGLNFFIPYGSTVFVSGTSGAGKTTLLRILAGLDKPDGGEISGLKNQKISLLFQEDRLLPWFTALQNVQAVIKDKEKLTFAKELLSELGLGDNNALSAYPSELSGGMSRRVSIARALALEFDILILDEALRGLDAENIENTVSVIQKYSKGKTLISVTHTPSSLEENCDQKIIIPTLS